MTPPRAFVLLLTVASSAALAQAPNDACDNCGTIESIQITKQKENWTPLGTVSQGGGSLASAGGNEARPAFSIGPGLSNQGVVVLGAAGGAAYAKRPTAYERPRWDVTVKLDRGGTRVLPQSYEPFVREGDRVRIIGTQLELLNP
jgi:outer membrane lipoprotein SlyB